jgi:hypothetical protein
MDSWICMSICARAVPSCETGVPVMGAREGRRGLALQQAGGGRHRVVQQGIAPPFQQAIAARRLVEGLGHALDDGAVLLLVDDGNGVEHHERAKMSVM